MSEKCHEELMHRSKQRRVRDQCTELAPVLNLSVSAKHPKCLNLAEGHGQVVFG
jgi:hypothetical protein